ncbi:MAG TPA: putative LPS assembly protein LptD, partial [Chitinophagaceae bacterium]|nr:putative LPS assembly protein LptD [Chitinophagaceae bacterium]
MNNASKVSSKYKLASFVALAFTILTVQSKDKLHSYHSFHNSLTGVLRDTIKPGKIILTDAVLADTLPKGKNNINDSTIMVQTIDTIDIKISKDSLDAVVEYNAEDSMIMDVPTKKITLYGKKAATQYKDNNLTAPTIEFDQTTGNVTASIRRDSAGKVIAMPTFKQGDFTSTSDSIRFNMKTGKGLTKSTYTQQNDMYVYGEVIKKISNDVFFAQRARITTCDLDTPHFAFVSNRMKLINQKLAITGPVHPEFEGVPIPIYLPFGIYPLSQGRHSGFLMPSFEANEQYGLGLTGLGYYKVLNDYWDVTVRGNLYSYGGWTMDINPRYTKRYRYNGNLLLGIITTKQNFKGDPDYAKNTNYSLQWSHNVDSKARPGVSFSANVNAASSGYNKNVPNNPYKNIENRLYSSINYAKTGTLEGFGEWWKDKSYNLTVAANHNQNTLDKLINVNLPDVGFSLSTIYPFRKTEPVGPPKWFENLGIGYNGNARSQFSFYDTAGNIFKHIADTLQYGAHHSIPISLSLPPLGAFQVSPSISYDETWFQTRSVRTWNSVTKKIDTTFSKGFYTARDMSFGINFSTRIFGMIASKSKTSKIQAIRHEITPSIGFSYHPSFNKKNYYLVQTDTSGKNFSLFSYYYDRNINSLSYTPNSSGFISFTLDNNLQMKVRSKKDTANGGLKKVSLIDNLGFSTGYDLFADSFALVPFSINASTNLFNKVSITGSANLDPYDVDPITGRRLKTLLWKRKPFSFGRMTNGNISLSSQFRGGDKTKKNSEPEIAPYSNARNGYSGDDYQNEMAYIRNNPGEYADFNIPWSVNFSYALSFGKFFSPADQKFKTTLDQNINLGGTLNLTPKW